MKKQLSGILAAVVFTTALSVSAFAAETVVPQQAIQTNITGDVIKDTAVTAAESKDDAAAKEAGQKFRSELKGQLDELNKLREECKANWESIKSLNQSIKAQWETVKANLKEMEKEQAKKIASELKGRIEPYRSQIKAVHAEVQAIRDLKKAEWDKFRAAVKEKNLQNASAALDTIIKYKAQIIEKQSVLSQAKNNILQALKGNAAV